MPHHESDPLNNSFEKDKPCAPSPAHPLDEEEKYMGPERESAPPIRLTPASSAAMMIEAPPLGCSLESLLCCSRREKHPELPTNIEMPESEGPPGEPLEYGGYVSALPTFGEERSPLFPGFCENNHFPAEALYLY